jgi:Tubulin binding cofactor A
MSEADRKALKIKTGSVNRLAKELNMYTQDEKRESQRVADMKRSGADSHDIKHAVRRLACFICSALQRHHCR